MISLSAPSNPGSVPPLGRSMIGYPLPFSRRLATARFARPRLAGVSLHYLTGLPTRDATNNFRAYSRRVIDEIPIEGEASFAVALELTVKAHWRGWKIAEVPTTWHDRTAGKSRFRLWAWSRRQPSFRTKTSCSG